MDLLYLLVAQIPRCPDLAILWRQADRQTKPITLSLVHVRGNVFQVLFTSSACGLALIVALSSEQYWVTIKCGCIHNILLLLLQFSETEGTCTGV